VDRKNNNSGKEHGGAKRQEENDMMARSKVKTAPVIVEMTGCRCASELVQRQCLGAPVFHFEIGQRLRVVEARNPVTDAESEYTLYQTDEA
jgi:hypothetical protein